MGAREKNMHSTSHRPVAPYLPLLPSTMSGNTNFQADPELGLGSGSVVNTGLEEGPAQARHEERREPGRVNSPLENDVDDAPNIPPEEPHKECNDFDDGANALWSLYENEVKPRDEAQIQTLKDDMDGVLIFAGLFSAVLTAFVVPKIQDLQVTPAQQSAFYQQQSALYQLQSAHLLSLISQQLALLGAPVPVNSLPPLPSYTLPSITFLPSASNRRVNVYWLLSLIFSLLAALLATLIQQWVRAYMRVFQRSSNPLKTARIRLFLFEGVDRLPMMADAVPGLIHLSLLLFFLGLIDTVLNIHKNIAFITLVPIALCGLVYFGSAMVPIWDPRWPYRNPFSSVIWHLVRFLHHHRYNNHVNDRGRATMEAAQEQLAMEQTTERKDRDVRAVLWLVESINGSTEMEKFVLAIPGSFDQDWGRKVWKEVSAEGVSQPDVTETQLLNVQAHHRPELPREGTAAYNLCRCVRYLFATYHNEGDAINKEALRRRMHGCVETTASLVCCTSIQLGWFGEVGEILSELAYNERSNEWLTISTNPSFTVRWTCLSLVAIRQTIGGQKLQELAKFAVGGIVRYQAEYGEPDALALKGAERIEGRLRRAWELIEDLHRAFEPWSPNRTDEEIKEILSGREAVISELEHMEVDADTMKDVDWRISLLQDAMDEATHKLTQRLPGVLFNEPKRAGPNAISEAFDIPLVETTPVTLQLILPGKRVQGLCTLGRRLRDIIEGRDPGRHKEILDNLESIDKIPIPLRRLSYLMKRQLWRLQDLRDGDGLGFMIELFFLALRQLTPTSLSSELKRVLFIGTFEIITCHWTESKDSIGTQRMLLDLICDLVIKSRGVFSDFCYPKYIVDKLLELVGEMVKGHNNPPHITEVEQELLRVDSRNLRDPVLQSDALDAIQDAAR